MYRRNNFGSTTSPQIKELNSALVKKQSQVSTLQSYLQDRMIDPQHKPLISQRLKVAQEALENTQERLEIAKKKWIEFQRKPQTATPPPTYVPEYIPPPDKTYGKKDEGEVAYFMLGQEEAQSGLPFRKQFVIQKGYPARMGKGQHTPARPDKTIGLEEYTVGYTAFIKDGQLDNDYYDVQDKGYSSQWAKNHLAENFPTEERQKTPQQTELSSDEKGLFDDPLIFWGGIGVLGLIIFKFAKKK